MKRVLVLLIVLLSISAFAADEDIELTPELPFPQETLFCKYLLHEQGEVITFSWSKNGEPVKEKTTDKPSDILNHETVKDDVMRCDVSKNVGRVLPIGSSAVTVGQNMCNDGEDNDNDGLVDLLDPGCEDRSDKEEFNIPADYCDNHPNNIFCMQLGFEEIGQICENDPGNLLCFENQVYVLGSQQCQADAGSVACLGVDNIIEYCNAGPGEICTLFSLMIQQCGSANLACFELTQEDKDFLCTVGRFDHCPEEVVEEDPVVEEEEPIVEEQPSQEEEEEPEQPAEDPVEESEPSPIDEPIPEPYQQVCGDGICDFDEPTTCEKDCVVIREPTKGEGIGMLLAGLLLGGGTVAGLLFLRKKRR